GSVAELSRTGSRLHEGSPGVFGWMRLEVQFLATANQTQKLTSSTALIRVNSLNSRLILPCFVAFLAATFATLPCPWRRAGPVRYGKNEAAAPLRTGAPPRAPPPASTLTSTEIA